MHRFFASVCAVFVLCVLGFGSSAGPTEVTSASVHGPVIVPQFTVRKQVNEVRVTFHAIDRHRRPVGDLTAEAVTIFDNDTPVPAITSFGAADDLPLSVALMVDASDSVSRDFAAEQNASSAFVRNLIRTRDDRVTLVAFRERLDVVQQVNANAEELASAVRQIRVGGLTALYDAVISTSDRLARTDMSASRRAIVLISDGDDTDSRYPLSDAVSAALRDDVAVYAISLRTRHSSYQGQQTLKTIANATGGRVYRVRKTEELKQAMLEIEQDLRSQYVVTYRPAATANGEFHRLRVVPRVNDMAIRARAGYFAANDR